MKFNINHNVFVKLNEEGRRIHREFWEPHSGGNYRAPKVSIDGYSEFQLWDLMRLFGPEISFGVNPPFATEIIIDCNRPIFLGDDQ